MTYQQLVTPDPDIPCRPGWCLQYVRQTFGAPIVEPTAAKGWANAQYRHEDWEFPDCWVPLWFDVQGEPAGHVVLKSPDGSIYSTTHPTSTTPTYHPNIQSLFDAYATYYPLTYLGWTEDISGVRVVQPVTTQYESTQEDDMPTAAEIANAVLSFNVDQVGGPTGQVNLGAFLAEYRANNNKIVEQTSAWVIDYIAKNPAALAQQINAAGVARDVYDELGKLFQKAGQ